MTRKLTTKARSGSSVRGRSSKPSPRRKTSKPTRRRKKTSSRARPQERAAKVKRAFYTFDKDEAARAVEFIETYCRHVKGEWAGDLFILERWEKEFVRNLFGWRRADGTRRYRRAYLEIPRKNGKSLLMAAIGLYLLFADGEPGAEIYSCAGDRSQAAIVFDLAKQIVEKERRLKRRCTIFRRSIIVPSTGSTYQVLSADASRHHGKNSSAILFDELHAQPNRELWDVMTSSTGSRRQPLVLAITTAGYDRESICWEQHDYAVKVDRGDVDDPTFLGVIYAADEDDDWTSEAVWRKANPNFGISIKPEDMHDECRRAKESPAHQNAFRRLRLNQWTEQATRWIDITVWDRGRGALPPWVELEDIGAWGGLDLATTTDIAALVWGFWLGDGVFGILPRLFCPEDTIALRTKRDRVLYSTWQREGKLIATPGNVVDYDMVIEQILDDAEHLDCREIGYDPWNATHVATRLQDEGLTIVPVRQGWKTMSPPTKELEKLVISNKLLHGGHPVLRWMAGNVAVMMDPAGNLKPARDKSFEKIDGIVAAIMSLGRAMLEPEEHGSSRYDDEGVLVL